jgi:hypothetical protein
METIMCKSKAEYDAATKASGKNKIEMDFFIDLSHGKTRNIRHESGYEIWQDGEIIGACSSSSPVYIKNKYGTTDNRKQYEYTAE